ncbi:MAG: hypothetical protein KDA91_23585 [Planctomycetaceae bacterium]|nr:hypothetical protein [Planctomycetaceae bacterium]
MKLSEFSTLAFILTAFVSGCGQYGGGASVVPEVTVLPPDFGSGSDEGAGEVEGAAPTASSSSGGSGFGTLEGRIVLTGTAPVVAPLIAAGADVKDKEVCAETDVPDDKFVLGSDNGIENVFVYLSKAPKGGKGLEAGGDDIIFDQKGCRFKPHALIVPTGRTLRVLSGDAVAHNTHTYPQKNDSVNSGVAPNDREGVLNFQYRRAESAPIAVTCDYHGWMKAWHLPIDHPYAAVTQDGGKFTIADLPAGKHQLALWHESVDGNFIERKYEVTIQSDATNSVVIEVPSSRFVLN